jgi:hypothetical protein
MLRKRSNKELGVSIESSNSCERIFRISPSAGRCIMHRSWWMERSLHLRGRKELYSSSGREDRYAYRDARCGVSADGEASDARVGSAAPRRGRRLRAASRVVQRGDGVCEIAARSRSQIGARKRPQILTHLRNFVELQRWVRLMLAKYSLIPEVRFTGELFVRFRLQRAGLRPVLRFRPEGPRAAGFREPEPGLRPSDPRNEASWSS